MRVSCRENKIVSVGNTKVGSKVRGNMEADSKMMGSMVDNKEIHNMAMRCNMTACNKMADSNLQLTSDNFREL